MCSMKYEEALKSIHIRSVSLGDTTVHLFDVEQMNDGQIGYSVDEDGNSLMNDEEGSWKKEWLVIGYEDLCGDPVFIDILADGFPVYTAMHGAGSWNARLIAGTLKGFAGALEIIASLSSGRESPVELEANPIPSYERDRALAEIRNNNPGADMEFWELWLGAQ